MKLLNLQSRLNTSFELGWKIVQNLLELKFWDSTQVMVWMEFIEFIQMRNNLHWNLSSPRPSVLPIQYLSFTFPCPTGAFCPRCPQGRGPPSPQVLAWLLSSPTTDSHTGLTEYSCQCVSLCLCPLSLMFTSHKSPCFSCKIKFSLHLFCLSYLFV